MSKNIKSKLQRFILNIFILTFSTIFFESALANSKYNTKDLSYKSSYLDSKNELEDYILDTGDSIIISFENIDEFSNEYTVDEEGEIFLPRLRKTNVRGLTTNELKNLLEEKYLKYLIDPEISIRIKTFKEQRILVTGEVRNPGIYKFAPYTSLSFSPDIYLPKNDKKTQNIDLSDQVISDANLSLANEFDIKKNNNLITLSKAIKKAGGITSWSDLEKVEIIREVPIGKGGGKKRAIINLLPFLEQSSNSNNIRIFDGDKIFIRKSTTKDPSIVSKSILVGVSPKFIKVSIFGRVEAPGNITLPLEASLSDAINITGPIKPLSGKVFIIRYDSNNNLIKKKINYLAKARPGTINNPLLKDQDMITIKNSVLGKTTGVIKEITEPLSGIYQTKLLIDAF